MWIRLGVQVPLTDEEEKNLAVSNTPEEDILKVMKERGFTIDGDSYVPESCSPFAYDEKTDRMKYVGYDEGAGEEFELDFNPTDCTIATMENSND